MRQVEHPDADTASCVGGKEQAAADDLRRGEGEGEGGVLPRTCAHGRTAEAGGKAYGVGV